MNLSRSTMKKLMVLIVFAAVCLAVSQHFSALGSVFRFVIGILSPFLIGASIAFILNVPMRSVEDLLFSSPKVQQRISAPLRRGISLLLTFLLVIAVIAVLVLVIVPQLTSTITGLGGTIQSFFTRTIAWGQEMFANDPELLQWINSISIDWTAINWESILNKVGNFLKNGAGNVLTSTITVAKGFFSGVATAFVSFVFACYLLLQKEKLALQCRKVFFALFSTQTATRVIEICALSHRIFSSFITGQCLEAVILGFMFFLTMTVLGMPYALLVGCLIAVTALIPIVGAFIGCGVGAFLILMVSPMQALVFVVMFLILQQIEGNLIYPHVVGNSVGLPSIWVLAAVSIGGSLMGVLGMLTFIPLTSVLYTLFRGFVYQKLSDKNISVL